MIRNDDLGYPIIVSSETLENVRQFVASKGYKRIVVVTDGNPALAKTARQFDRAIPGSLGIIQIPLGEKRKRLATVEQLLDRFITLDVDRTTLVLGVGGGVASDLFGFAAAIYMRGVPYAHVATSLVAMVDAGIGGKTGVDLSAGKNLAGVFQDPRAVFCDIPSLNTLPFRNIREGLAEMVKHAIIEGGDLFERMGNLAIHPFEKWPWEEIVADSLKVKTMLVADDRTEQGSRELLNLGHTFAHGFERASDYRISHGAAVSLGLRAAGLLALRIGRFSEGDHLRLLALLALLRLPMQVPKALEPDEILTAMQTDKKKRDGKLRFVVPNAIGDVDRGVTVSDTIVRQVLRQLRMAPTDAEFASLKKKLPR